MKVLLAPSGKPRGYINETSTRKFIHAPGGRMLGWYDKNQDRTFTSTGKPVGTGDQTAYLLEG